MSGGGASRTGRVVQRRPFRRRTAPAASYGCGRGFYASIARKDACRGVLALRVPLPPLASRMSRANDRRRAEARQYREPGLFVPMPVEVLRSPQFACLSANGVKLLCDLLSQWRLGGNGDLCATWTVMHARGWRSRDTLSKALKELLDKRWIVQTRQGGRHRPSLYAVTFFSLDESSKLDITRRDFPKSAWSSASAARALVPDRHHARRVTSISTNTPIVPNGMSETAA